MEVIALFNKIAWIPISFNEVTWSYIKEINGDTTIVIPSNIKAGTWKQIDFPADVGIIASTSLLDKIVSIISA